MYVELGLRVSNSNLTVGSLQEGETQMDFEMDLSFDGEQQTVEEHELVSHLKQHRRAFTCSCYIE